MKLLALVLVSIVGGCAEPLPEGVLLANVDAAAEFILENWGLPKNKRPAIYGVDPDPKCGNVGFIDPKAGKCVGGFTGLPDAFSKAFNVHTQDIYLLITPQGYSQGLPHELAHSLWGDVSHRNPEIWGTKRQYGGPGDEGMVPIMARILEQYPELNQMIRGDK